MQNKQIFIGNSKIRFLIPNTIKIQYKKMKQQAKNNKTNNPEIQFNYLKSETLNQQVRSLCLEIQQLKIQISVVEYNLMQICQLCEHRFQKLEHSIQILQVGPTESQILHELNAKFKSLQLSLKQSAQRQEIIMHDIETISNRVLNVQHTVQANIDRDFGNMDQISSAECSQAECPARFHSPYQKIYHKKHVHNRQYEV